MNTTVLLNCSVFLDIPLCSSLRFSWRFEGKYCLHIQDLRIRACSLLLSCPKCSFETSIDFQWTTWWYIPVRLFITTSVRTSIPKFFRLSRDGNFLRSLLISATTDHKDDNHVITAATLYSWKAEWVHEEIDVDYCIMKKPGYSCQYSGGIGAVQLGSWG
jgi:hypothetical protein